MYTFTDSRSEKKFLDIVAIWENREHPSSKQGCRKEETIINSYEDLIIQTHMFVYMVLAINDKLHDQQA